MLDWKFALSRLALGPRIVTLVAQLSLWLKTRTSVVPIYVVLKQTLDPCPWTEKKHKNGPSSSRRNWYLHICSITLVVSIRVTAGEMLSM